MKVVGFLCVYNDSEFLDAAISSFKDFTDRLFIIEGAWQSALTPGGNPRSGSDTYRILEKHVDSSKVILIQANEATEIQQRQVGLELAKQEGADWCFSIDADEVYPPATLNAIRQVLTEVRYEKEFFGLRIHSYNFINGFNHYYDGCYTRIYRVTPQARFVVTNDVAWPDYQKDYYGRHVATLSPQFRFFHYSYVRKDPNVFNVKMRFLEKEDPGFGETLRTEYGFENGIYKIPSSHVIMPFHGVHPDPSII